MQIENRVEILAHDGRLVSVPAGTDVTWRWPDPDEQPGLIRPDGIPQAKPEANEFPASLLGWTIQKQGPYRRMFRRIEGKLYSIYVGKTWDERRARRLIRKKEQSLGCKWTPEKIAIDYIQRNEPPNGYFVGFSGGKDSIVTLDLVKRSGVRFRAYYTDFDIDPPEAKQFILEHHPEIEWVPLRHSFWDQMLTRGLLLRHRRWCTELKKKSVQHIPQYRRIMGLRAAESAPRKKLGKTSKDGKITVFKPIFEWSDGDVWEYITERKLPYCKLYDEGFERIGCVICPFFTGRPKILEQYRNRWPEYYRRFEAQLEALYNKRDWYRERVRGYAYTFEDYLQNWYNGAN